MKLRDKLEHFRQQQNYFLLYTKYQKALDKTSTVWYNVNVKRKYKRTSPQFANVVKLALTNTVIYSYVSIQKDCSFIIE